jgi:hypothetical protein
VWSIAVIGLPLVVVGVSLIVYSSYPIFPETRLFKELHDVGEKLVMQFSLGDCAHLMCQVKIASLPLALMVVCPWELWVNLPKVLPWLKGLFGLPMLFIFLGGVVIWASVIHFWDVVERLSRVVIGMGGIALIVCLGFFLRDVWQWISDRMRLRRLVVPDQVDRPWVYQTCGSLKSSAGRQHFLESLRLRRVEVTDEPGPRLVNQLWIDPKVEEGLARLESVWQGLEE